MGVELATCGKCGHIIDKDYIKGRYQWNCTHCNKIVKPVWKSPESIESMKNPALYEPYEPLDGTETEINIDDFQDRLNANTF